jgi:prepilin-type N-terminal cleavage/methylation domain-containing protein
MMKKGFTLIEIIVVMAIFLTLTGLAMMNILRPQQQAILSSATHVLITDIKSQQLKSMIGESSTGTAPEYYGIYFESNKYTLFPGTIYDANNANNFVVNLDSTLQISANTFPSSQVVFNRISGEVSNFSSNNNSVTLKNLTNLEVKKVSINAYGAITLQ